MANDDPITQMASVVQRLNQLSSDVRQLSLLVQNQVMGQFDPNISRYLVMLDNVLLFAQ